MERWNKLLVAHNTVLADRGWSAEVRIDTCRLLMRKMLELENLKPLPRIDLPEISPSTAELVSPPTSKT